jgi:hypothetical protein
MHRTRLEKATLVTKGSLDRGAIPQGVLYSNGVAWFLVALANSGFAA